jgi:hypothetical protein
MRSNAGGEWLTCCRTLAVLSLTASANSLVHCIISAVFRLACLLWMLSLRVITECYLWKSNYECLNAISLSILSPVIYLWMIMLNGLNRSISSLTVISECYLWSFSLHAISESYVWMDGSTPWKSEVQWHQTLFPSFGCPRVIHLQYSLQTRARVHTSEA